MPILPVMGPAVVGAVSSVLGGLFGKKESRKQQQSEAAMQKEFAQHGIRWRVEDAKAAGLHPLYAMGAQIPSYQPSFNVGGGMGPAIAEAGQNIARGMASQLTPSERSMRDLQTSLLEKQIAETDARIGVLNSEAARNWLDIQGGSGGFPGETVTVGELQAPDVQKRGLVQVVPSQVGSTTPGDQSLGAGESPAWRRYNVAPDFQVLLPGGPQGNIEEALESVTESIPAMVAVIAENLTRNPTFTEEAVSHYMGREAAAVYRALKSVPIPSVRRTLESMRRVREGFGRWEQRFRDLQR